LRHDRGFVFGPRLLGNAQAGAQLRRQRASAGGTISPKTRAPWLPPTTRSSIVSAGGV
jgi:hypothetical protein